MNIGDLVRDTWLDMLGIIIDLQWDEEHDEMLAVVQLLDGSRLWYSYEDMEVINGSR